MLGHVSSVVGRYAIHEEIASGGMASVHLGRLLGPVGFSRTVAIKRLHPHIAKDDDFVSMFIDEARLAARVRHPNVVQTLDVVQAEGELLLVMEYVHGAQLSLLHRLAARSGEPIPPSIVVAIVAGMLRGLHAAHDATDEQGTPLDIVHRDISPHNVMVGVDGVARVIDFGVAKAAGRLQQSSSGQLKGKIPYMAPEQVRGDRVTRRTDIFAAGIVLWESLVGKRLFTADNEAAVIGQVLSYEIPAPSEVDRGLPTALDAVVMRALERKPSLRFDTARDMARALESCVAVAPPAEVGEWVERIARETLIKRTNMVAHVESSTMLPAVSASSARVLVAEPPPRIINEPPPEPRSDASNLAMAGTAPVEAGGTSRLVGALALLLGFAAIIGAGFLIGRQLLREPPEVVPAPATSVVQTTPSTSSAPIVSASASASASALKPKTRPTKIDCNPNYYFDAQGVRHHKQYCP